MTFTDLNWLDEFGDPVTGSIIAVTADPSSTMPIESIIFGSDTITFKSLGFTLFGGGPGFPNSKFVTLSIETVHDVPIGGTFVPIDQSALLLAGVQSVSMWMIPVILAGAGIGLFVIKRRN